MSSGIVEESLYNILRFKSGRSVEDKVNKRLSKAVWKEFVSCLQSEMGFSTSNTYVVTNIVNMVANKDPNSTFRKVSDIISNKPEDAQKKARAIEEVTNILRKMDLGIAFGELAEIKKEAEDILKSPLNSPDGDGLPNVASFERTIQYIDGLEKLFKARKSDEFKKVLLSRIKPPVKQRSELEYQIQNAVSILSNDELRDFYDKALKERTLPSMVSYEECKQLYHEANHERSQSHVAVTGREATVGQADENNNQIKQTLQKGGIVSAFDLEVPPVANGTSRVLCVTTFDREWTVSPIQALKNLSNNVVLEIKTFFLNRESIFQVFKSSDQKIELSFSGGITYELDLRIIDEGSLKVLSNAVNGFSHTKMPILQQKSGSDKQPSVQLAECIIKEDFAQLLQIKGHFDTVDNNVRFVENTRLVQEGNDIAIMNYSEAGKYFSNVVENQNTSSKGVQVDSTQSAGKNQNSSGLEQANKNCKHISSTRGKSKQPSYSNINNSVQQNARSKLPVVVASVLAVTGVALGIAIAVHLGMLTVGITVGTCCLVVAKAVYYYDEPSPSQSLENTKVTNGRKTSRIGQEKVTVELCK